MEGVGGVDRTSLRISFSMPRRKSRSLAEQNETASPPAPARAVRPMRWMYTSGSTGDHS